MSETSARDVRACLVNQRDKPGSVRELDLLLAEVQFELQQGSHLHEFTPEKGKLVREPAAELVISDPVRRGRRGRNQVRDRLGLGQVHLAVHEGPAGELARSGQAAAGRQQPADQLVGNISRSVERNLHRVLAGVAVRGAKYRYQHVIQPRNFSVMDGITITFRNASALQLNDCISKAEAVRTADPDNRNCSGPRDGGRSNDGIGGGIIHTG